MIEQMTSIGDIPVLERGNSLLSARIFKTLQANLYLETRLAGMSHDEPYNIRATAKRMGVVFERHDGFVYDGRLAETRITTVENDERFLVAVHEKAVEWSPAERFLFGHELAHIFLLECMQGAIRKGLRSDKYVRELSYGAKHHDEIEHFCDYFAYQAEDYRKA